MLKIYASHLTPLGDGLYTKSMTEQDSNNARPNNEPRSIAPSGTEYMRIPVAEYTRLKASERALADALRRAATAETQLSSLATVRQSKDAPTDEAFDATVASVSLDTPQRMPGPVKSDDTDEVFDADDEGPTDEFGFPLERPKPRKRTVTNGQDARSVKPQQAPNTTIVLGGAPQPTTVPQLATQRVLKAGIQYGEMFRLATEGVALTGDHTANTRHQLTVTPSQVQIALEAIELGMNRAPAFAMAAVNRHNYDYYVRRAKEGAEPYNTLLMLIEIAEARFEAQLTYNWQLHTAENWQAAKELLVKRFPEQWGDKRPRSINIKELLAMSPEKLREILGDEIADAIDAEYEDEDDDDA